MGTEISNYGVHQNEINLFDLIQIFWKNKWVMLLTPLILVALTSFILHFIKPVYEVNVSLKQPFPSQVIDLNFNDYPFNFNRISTVPLDDLYMLFLENVGSKNTRRIFLEKNVDANTLNKKERPQFSLVNTVRRNKDEYSLKVRGYQPKPLKEWAIAYLNIAQEETKSVIATNLNHQIKNALQQFERTILLKKQITTTLKNDRLAQLEEAKIMSQNDSLSDKYLSEVVNAAIESGNNSILNQANSLYLRSKKSLNDELVLLKKRDSDEPFIPGLRELQQAQEFYKAFIPSIDKTTLFRIDKSLLSAQIVYPRYKIILVLAFFTGLFASTIWVFIRNTERLRSAII